MGDWINHPVQHATSGGRKDLPKHSAGPVITPETIDGNHVAPCIITGHCDSPADDPDHAKCWQADGVEPPSHDLGACPGPHRLRCRCTCHNTMVLF